MWTSRAALFGAGMVLVGLVLHRLYWLSTPVMLNLVELALILEAAAIVLAIAAFMRIWQTGGPGFARAVVALVLAAAVFAWPLSLLPTMAAYPAINDVTTDRGTPPAFDVLARSRPATANDPGYAGEAMGAVQAKAYPDIAPLTFQLGAADVFDLATRALKRGKNKMQVVNEKPPESATRPGLIEAVDRTLFIGFADDVVIRVSGDRQRARVDIRSASRYGRHDLGQNARRVRALMKDITARVESAMVTPAGPGAGARSERTGKAVKRPKGRDRREVNRRN